MNIIEEGYGGNHDPRPKMIYTFREVATIYTTVEAESEEDAWGKLDEAVLTIPDNMTVDVMGCEIIEIGEKA
jgi:hypothetical protein